MSVYEKLDLQIFDFAIHDLLIHTVCSKFFTAISSLSGGLREHFAL